MSEEYRDYDEPDELEPLPEVAVQEKPGISFVWLIPLVAAIIGAGLAYKTVTEKGPTITVVFKDGGGLEEDKTRIKYRSVEVGVVKTVALSEDLSHVVVTAELHKSAEPHLKEGTQFWLVRPRISATRVTGLETLVSGVYVEMEPGPGKAALAFTALENPPVVRKDAPGIKYVLKADSLGSLNNGSPIFFRDIQVGEVLGYEITDDTQGVDLHIFIKEPYDKLVRRESKFWNLSGFEASVTADGIKMRTESLASMLAGGIAFYTPGNLPAGAPPPENAVFRLHSSYEDTVNEFTRSVDLIMYFDGSVRGLKVGAPVEFRGIQVGRVKEVRMEYNEKTLDIRIPVLIELQPERVKTIGKPSDNPVRDVERLVQRGLRARLKTGSLLTGQLFVEMDLLPDTPLNLIGGDNGYPEIPTLPSTLDEIAKTTTEIMQDLKELPLEELIRSLIVTAKSVQRLVDSVEVEDSIASFNQSMEQLQSFLGSIDGKVIAPLATTLEKGESALAEMESMISEDSPIRVDLAKSLEELSGAARSMRILADYLERHPEALVHGKAGPRR